MNLGGRAVATATPAPAITQARTEPAERMDEPERMYLRDMGSVELLSREGEIAIEILLSRLLWSGSATPSPCVRIRPTPRAPVQQSRDRDDRGASSSDGDRWCSTGQGSIQRERRGQPS